MSDEQTTRTDADETTGEATATTMPPTRPIGSESVSDPSAAAEPETSGSPIGKAADAAAEAARTATARLKEAAENADLDRLAEDAKRVTGEWTEKVRDEYRRRPGVVIGAAVAGVVVLGAVARAIGRRR